MYNGKGIKEVEKEKKTNTGHITNRQTWGEGRSRATKKREYINWN